MKLKLSSLLGILGIIVLGICLMMQPILGWYFFVLILPSYLFSYLFIKDLTFLERVCISLPLGGLFQVLLTLLSFIGIPLSIPLIWILLVILPVALIAIKERKKLNGLKSDAKSIILSGYKKNSSDLLALGVILVVSLFIWGMLLQGVNLPRSDQVNNHAQINEIYQEITTNGRVPRWTSKLSMGLSWTHELYYHYERIALLHIMNPSKNLVFNQNGFAFFSIFMGVVGIFCVCRRFGQSSPVSVLVASLFLANPLLSSKLGFSGDMREISTFVYLTALLIGMSLLTNKKRFSDWRLYAFIGIIAALDAHSHIVTFLIHALVVGAFYVIIALRRLGLKGLLAKGHLASIGALVLVFFSLIAFHFIPAAVDMDYGTADIHKRDLSVTGWFYGMDIKIGSLKNFMTVFINDSISNQFTINLNRLYTIFAVFGVLSAIYLLIFRKKQDTMLPDFILAFILGLILLTLLLLTNKLHPEFSYLRMMLMSLLALCMAMPLAFRLSKNRIFRGILFTMLLLICLYFADFSRGENTLFVSETAQNGLFKQHYDAMYNAFGPGRAITYGIYMFGVEPAIPVVSNLWMVTHTAMAIPSYPQADLKDSSENFPSQYPITYLSNRFRTTFTKYVLVFKCGYGEAAVAVEKYFDSNLNFTGMQKIFSDQCHSLYVVADTNYAEKTTLIKSDIPEKTLYSYPFSYRGFGFHDENVYTGKDYVIIDNETGFLDFAPPVRLAFELVNRDHIAVTGSLNEGDWVILKDHYYPGWKAYMDGKEIQLYKSNYLTMLVQTKAGSRIDFIHELLPYEKALIIFAILFIAGSMYLLIDRKE